MNARDEARLLRKHSEAAFEAVWKSNQSSGTVDATHGLISHTTPRTSPPYMSVDEVTHQDGDFIKSRAGTLSDRHVPTTNWPSTVDPRHRRRT